MLLLSQEYLFLPLRTYSFPKICMLVIPFWFQCHIWSEGCWCSDLWSEGFNLLLEPLPTKIIFPLWNGTGIHCELTSINLSLQLRKADELWFCFSVQSHRANYGKNLIYRSTSKALEWDACLFTLLPFILHYLFMLPAHGFERLFG